jgi:hypothetical protein
MVAVWLLTVACVSASQAPQPAAAAANTSTVPESVDVRYARAQLQLAEANLQRMRQINQRLPRSVPASVVAEYQQDVDVAKTQVQQAELNSGKDEFQVWLRRAESAWKTAHTLWKNGVAVNQRSPGTIEALDVERFRLRAELNRLQLERGQALAKAPREAQVQWQLELLNNEVQQVKEEATRAAPFSRYYPRFW